MSMREAFSNGAARRLMVVTLWVLLASPACVPPPPVVGDAGAGEPIAATEVDARVRDAGADARCRPLPPPVVRDISPDGGMTVSF